MNASRQMEEREAGASSDDVRRRINELKYLTSQKTIPRLSLRKEILELEQELKGIFSAEEQLMTKKNRSTLKIAALKSQIDQLKKQLDATKNKDLNQKVEKLSHLIGESLAHHETKQDVALSQTTEKELPEDKIRIINGLENRLASLKTQLLMSDYSGDKKAEKIKQQIALLEGKINSLKDKLGMTAVERQSRHTLLFNLKSDDKALKFESELPLPPPPRKG